MITKLADTLLKDYQQRVLDRLDKPDTPGLIAWHSTGSGKTLAALKAFQQANERTGKPGLFITPASLVNNARKEIASHNLPLNDANLSIMSYEKALRDIGNLGAKDYGLVAFDEAHKLRNQNTARARKLRELAMRADKTLLLTGTAGYNSPTDLGSLAKFINPKLKVPETVGEFERAYVNPATGKFTHGDKLRKLLGPYVDVYQRPQDSADFPEVRKEVVHVPMSEKQEKLYKYLIWKLPSRLRKAVNNNLPISAKESANLNAFATGIRQVSDSPMHHDINAKPEDSPKLVEAVRRMSEAAKAPNFRGVVYSNYIDAGLNPYAELLRKKGIEPMLFTGGMNAKQKKELVDSYNIRDKKPRVLLLSSSGGEGLDLKGTRLLQVLEPHFNQAKIDQVMGRGARYRSHVDLPPEERKLLVEQFHSTMPERWHNKWLGVKRDTAIDDYLDTASKRKQGIIDGIRGALTS